MPVEIRELVIRAVVTEQQSACNGRDNRQINDETERTLIIQECVREVLRQLEKTRDR